jgi:galactokinase
MKQSIRIFASIVVFALSASAETSQRCEKLFNGTVGIGHARVAISGSHTDYNKGWTLAALLPVKTTSIVNSREDDVISVKSGGKSFSYHLGSEAVTGDWGDYIRGITAVLREDGISIKGADIEIYSDIPMGAGISSSAALVTSIYKALRGAYNLKIDDLQIAKMGQRVEHFVGARTGLLDQMTISLLDQDVTSALLINFSDMTYQKVKMPSDAEFVIVHSGLTHSLKDIHGDRNYATRRAECEGVCDRLKIPNLSTITLSELDSRKSELELKNYQRARHVVTENDRVRKFVTSATAGNLMEMGQLMNESHQSQKDDYDISEAPIDLLASLLRVQPGVYGAQLTGGGFGGAVVFLAKKGEWVRIAEKVMAQYLADSSNGGQFKPHIIAPIEDQK